MWGRATGLLDIDLDPGIFLQLCQHHPYWHTRGTFMDIWVLSSDFWHVMLLSCNFNNACLFRSYNVISTISSYAMELFGKS